MVIEKNRNTRLRVFLFDTKRENNGILLSDSVIVPVRVEANCFLNDSLCRKWKANAQNMTVRGGLRLTTWDKEISRPGQTRFRLSEKA